MGCQKGNHERSHSKREQLNLSGSFVRNDDGNSDDNVINQWFDWLNEEIGSCCTCGTHLGGNFCLLQENHSYQSSERTLRLFCTHDQHRIIAKKKALNLTRSSILMWRHSRCSCRRSLLNSVLTRETCLRSELPTWTTACRVERKKWCQTLYCISLWITLPRCGPSPLLVLRKGVTVETIYTRRCNYAFRLYRCVCYREREDWARRLSNQAKPP